MTRPNRPTKEQLRELMHDLAKQKLNDKEARESIYNLAQEQLYKSPQAFEQFCTNCAIFYTASPYILSHKMKSMSNEELSKWPEDFVEQCSYQNMHSLEVLRERYSKKYPEAILP